MSAATKRQAGHAVVLGASMAGLLAARVLADRFERVTIVERDRLPSGVDGRKGVPQGRHVHGFWARGLEVLESLMPGLRDQLIRGGACPCDVGRDFEWHQFGVPKLRAELGVRAITMSRPFLESHVRKHVLARPEIAVIEEATIRGLVATADRSRVSSVSIERAGSEESIAADLVVDATGRAGHATRWLESLGYDAPRESSVAIDVRYASRMYERDPSDRMVGRIAIDTPPQGKRGGVCFAVEGNRWLVTLIGFAGEVPPTNDAHFLAYAATLPSAAIHNAIRTAKPLTEIVTHRFPTDLRRHYERLARFPRGLLVIGDALCSFNPAYGQGMTVAALEADALAKTLAEGIDRADLAKRFFRATAKVIHPAWTLVSGEDLRYPEVEGHRPPGLSAINRYITRVHRAAATDAEVCRAFFRVAGFEAEPTAVFAPRILLRALGTAGSPSTLGASERLTASTS